MYVHIEGRQRAIKTPVKIKREKKEKGTMR
jgi:hypothetical protein